MAITQPSDQMSEASENASPSVISGTLTSEQSLSAIILFSVSASVAEHENIHHVSTPTQWEILQVKQLGS